MSLPGGGKPQQNVGRETHTDTAIAVAAGRVEGRESEIGRGYTSCVDRGRGVSAVLVKGGTLVVRTCCLPGVGV